MVGSHYFQVLTYAQQSRERSNYEQAALNERMQEYKRQVDRESRWSSNGSNGSPNGDGIQAIGRSSHKMIEAVMQSAAKGKVLLKTYLILNLLYLCMALHFFLLILFHLFLYICSLEKIFRFKQSDRVISQNVPQI